MKETSTEQTDNGKTELRKRFELSIIITIIGALLTFLVYEAALIVPFPQSWGVPGFIALLGAGVTLFLIFGAVFAPATDGESL